MNPAERQETPSLERSLRVSCVSRPGNTSIDPDEGQRWDAGCVERAPHHRQCGEGCGASARLVQCWHSASGRAEFMGQSHRGPTHGKGYTCSFQGSADSVWKPLVISEQEDVASPGCRLLGP